MRFSFDIYAICVGLTEVEGEHMFCRMVTTKLMFSAFSQILPWRTIASSLCFPGRFTIYSPVVDGSYSNPTHQATAVVCLLPVLAAPPPAASIHPKHQANMPASSKLATLRIIKNQRPAYFQSTTIHIPMIQFHPQFIFFQ